MRATRIAAVSVVLFMGVHAYGGPFEMYGYQSSGFSTSDWGLIKFSTNPINGKSTRIGKAGPLGDMDFRDDGTLFGGWSKGLMRIDTTTGAATVVAPWGANVPSPIVSLSFSPSGVLYGMDLPQASSRLYTIDPATGVATVVGALGFRAYSLSFGPDGTLYAGRGDGVYTVNSATGALGAKVASISLLPAGFVAALDWGADGVFRAAINDGEPASPDQLVEVRLSDGTMPLIAKTSETDIGGLATIPAPGVFSIAGLSAIYATRRRPY
jgi:hypothetical protein